MPGELYRAPTKAPATPREVLEQLKRVEDAIRKANAALAELTARIAALEAGP